MASASPLRTIRVVGLRAEGEGYPNAGRTIALLSDSGVDIVDHGQALPPGLHLWRLRTLGVSGQLRQVCAIAWGNAISVMRMLLSPRGRGAPVYIPYPAMFAMWLLSWLPYSMRPHCIVDAYISVWDASFRDRGSGGGMASKVVKAFEARALRAASVVVVDTVANSHQFVEDFGLDPARVRAFPLAIDEARFLAIPEAAPGCSPALRVLFVGTLIPLHGVEHILEAAGKLAGSHPEIRFRIVGDGQLGATIEQFVEAHPDVKLEWVREWCDLDAIAAEIARADICLGVFGGDGKAARVLPFKLYMYLAAGRPIISQLKGSTPDGVPPPPIVGIDPAARDSLADAVVQLARLGADARAQLGRGAREYYLARLANTEVARRWSELTP